MAKKTWKALDLGDFSFTNRESSESFWNKEEAGKPTTDAQMLEVHLSKKGRAGKTAILIKGFKGENGDLKTVAKALRNHCGVGGSVKNGEIIIQGNVREAVIKHLAAAGYQTKRVGG